MKKIKFISKRIALLLFAFTVFTNYTPGMEMRTVEAANSLLVKYAADYGVSPEILEKGLNVCFNYIYYYYLNPDLSSIGLNQQALLEHFLSTGLLEGRIGSPVWDVKSYLAYNPDQAAAFQEDYRAAFKHFIDVGIYEEERITSAFYQGSLYKQLYSDLSALDGYDLAEQWLNYGIDEARISNPFGNMLTGWDKNTFSFKNAGAKDYFRFPLDSYTRISDDYGYRTNPISHDRQLHNGIDIAAPQGTKIHAAAQGTVVEAAYNSSMGYYVKINHDDGLSTIYMHASKLYVRKGDTVNEGSIIGAVGRTGSTTGNHLHFGVKLNGKYVSPWEYLEK